MRPQMDVSSTVTTQPRQAVFATQALLQKTFHSLGCSGGAGGSGGNGKHGGGENGEGTEGGGSGDGGCEGGSGDGCKSGGSGGEKLLRNSKEWGRFPDTDTTIP